MIDFDHRHAHGIFPFETCQNPPRHRLRTQIHLKTMSEAGTNAGRAAHERKVEVDDSDVRRALFGAAAWGDTRAISRLAAVAAAGSLNFNLEAVDCDGSAIDEGAPVMLKQISVSTVDSDGPERPSRQVSEDDAPRAAARPAIAPTPEAAPASDEPRRISVLSASRRGACNSDDSRHGMQHLHRSSSGGLASEVVMALGAHREGHRRPRLCRSSGQGDLLATIDQPGDTCLHRAIRHGQVAAALHLVTLGADVHQRDGRGVSAVDLAFSLGRGRFARRMLQAHSRNVAKAVANVLPVSFLPELTAAYCLETE
jgi:hypothetical protein